jgi:CBS domain-containing protein
MDHYVIDAMCKTPVMVGPDHSTRAAVADAHRSGVHQILVTDGDHLVGVLSAEELERARPETPTSTLLTASPITVEEQATLEEAEALMDRHDVDCLPVLTWEGLLRGVITRGDIRRYRASRSSVPPSMRLECAACGSREDVIHEPDVLIAFCVECLRLTQGPTQVGDELYITLGGED